MQNNHSIIISLQFVLTTFFSRNVKFLDIWSNLSRKSSRKGEPEGEGFIPNEELSSVKKKKTSEKQYNFEILSKTPSIITESYRRSRENLCGTLGTHRPKI